MKRLITICVVVGMVLGVSSVANATLYVETFDSNNAGWVTYTQPGTSPADADWSGSGGNPDGYISRSLTPTSSDLIISFQPTGAWHGEDGPLGPWDDMELGQTMTADFKINGTAEDVLGSWENAMVRFYIGSPSPSVNYYTTTDAWSWNPNDDTDWTTHQVALIATNFRSIYGTGSFADTLANASDIGLQFGASKGKKWSSPNSSCLGFAGTDTTVMLDNFGTVPEPATIALLGLGSLTLLRKKRRA